MTRKLKCERGAAEKWGSGGSPLFINPLCPNLSSMYFLSINFNDPFQPLIKDKGTHRLGGDFAVSNEPKDWKC